MVTRALLQRGIALPSRTVTIAGEAKQVPVVVRLYPAIEDYIRAAIFMETGNRGATWGMQMDSITPERFANIINEAVTYAEQMLVADTLHRLPATAQERRLFDGKTTFLGGDKTLGTISQRDYLDARAFRRLHESTITPAPGTPQYAEYQRKLQLDLAKWRGEISQLRGRVQQSMSAAAPEGAERPDDLRFDEGQKYLESRGATEVDGTTLSLNFGMLDKNMQIHFNERSSQWETRMNRGWSDPAKMTITGTWHDAQYNQTLRDLAEINLLGLPEKKAA